MILFILDYTIFIPIRHILYYIIISSFILSIAHHFHHVMSNFEDDEALFDDIYSGDQPKSVETVPAKAATEAQPPAESSTFIAGSAPTDSNNNDTNANTNTNVNTNVNTNINTNNTANTESSNDTSLQPSNPTLPVESTTTTNTEQSQQGVADQFQGQAQTQTDYANAFQQLQQFQMMQPQQSQQQQPMGGMTSMPNMPGVPGMAVMQGMPGMPGMPQLSQLQQYQQFQSQNQQPQQQQEQENTEHIPDITEIEVPTNFTDTVKADLVNKDVGKLFIGGLNWETDEERLKQYFSKYGEVLDVNVMRDGSTGKSRGFAFLTFAASDSVDAVLKEKHILDGKLIDPKRAIPRDEQEKVGKVFVGGIAADVTPEEFRSFFEKFGSIIDSQLMINKDTGKSRGYGFVTYDSAEAVARVTKHTYVMFHGKKMEIKKAEPRNQHMKNQGRSYDNSNHMGGGYNNNNNSNSNNMGMMNNNPNGGYMMNGYGDMSQYWQQMQQMQQMQQYWMQMQQQQMQQQQNQQMSPSSQDAQLNMYQMSNDNGNDDNDDNDVPNPQERGGYGGHSRRDRRDRRDNYDEDEDDEDDESRPNLPSGPKKFREKGDRPRGGNGGGRYNERRSGGGGGGNRRSGKYRNGKKNNYHPYRR